MWAQNERERVTSITTGVWILYFKIRSLRERERKKKKQGEFCYLRPIKVALQEYCGGGF